MMRFLYNFELFLITYFAGWLLVLIKANTKQGLIVNDGQGAGCNNADFPAIIHHLHIFYD